MSCIRIALILAMIFVISSPVFAQESNYITTDQQRTQAEANLRAHRAQQQKPEVDGSSNTVHGSTNTPNTYGNEEVNRQLGLPDSANRSGGF
jgi:hypothetical protein